MTVTVNITATSVLEGSMAAAIVTRTGSMASPLTVNLATSNASEATVPPSVTIPAGAASAPFSVTAVDDLAFDDVATVVVAPQAAGHTGVSDVIDVINNTSLALPAGSATDVVNLSPRSQPGEFNLTLGPRMAPGVASAQFAEITAANAYQTSGENQSFQLDQFLPVDTTKTYALIASAKSGDEFGERYLPTNRQSFGYAAYDIDYKQIFPQHVLRFSGATDTTLAAPLSPGDTVIHLTNGTGWSNAAGAAAGTRGIAWYGYQNSQGATYANYTYTRNVALGGTSGLWNAGAVNGNVITLATPWAGPALPAGAAVRNTGVGSDAIYNVLNSQPVPGDWTWTQYAATFGGQVLQNGSDSPTQFRPGTAYIKPAILANQQGGFANFITWRDIGLAQVAAGTTPDAFALPIVDLSTVVPGDQRVALSQSSVAANALIRVNTTESYALTGRALNFSEVDERPMGFSSFDVDKKLIHPLHVAKFGDAADTTLAAALSPGDTSFLIASASGWSNDATDPAHSRSLAWYGYTDSTGHTYANYTYTRNVAYDFEDGLWDAGAIHFDAARNAYRVTLRQPWAGPAIAAGVAVRNSMSGEVDSQPTVPVKLQQTAGSTEWADYAATIGGGLWQNGRPSDAAFRPGTVYIQPTFFGALLWHDVVIGPAQDAIYGTPANPTARLLKTGANRQIEFAIDVLSKGALGGGPSVVIDSVAAPKFGTATIAPGFGPGGRAVISYESQAWLLGGDAITYTLRNTATNETFTATLTINVLGGNYEQTPALLTSLTSQAAIPNNPAPSVRGDDQAYDVVAGQTFVADVLAGPGLLDIVSDGTDVNVVRLLQAPSHGALSLNPDGSFTYIPTPGFFGFDSFKLEAFDGINATARTALLSVKSTEGLSIRRLKDIGVAMLNYESTKASFPLVSTTSTASHFDANGDPYLSWRVHILPFLGFQDLYNQFHLNEPWDSATNLPLASKMPDVFRDPSAAAGATTTRFQIISAEGMTYYWRRSNGKLVGPKFNQFMDGTSNTLLVVEVGADQANSWTRPDALDYDPATPLSALGAISTQGINGVMADGSTITLLPTIAPDAFASLVTLSGGESIDAGTLRRQYAESRGAGAVQSFGENASLNYMRNIALAMQNYESAKGSFPVSGLRDDQGNPFLSWRVHILPFMDRSDLYNRFHLNEPWDSPNNLPLLAEMPDIFRSAGDASNSTSTRLVTFYGTDVPFKAGAPNANAHGTTQAQLRDGADHTIMFFEAGLEAAEPWTRPTGIPFVKADPLSVAGTFPNGIIKVAMFGGAVLALPGNTSAATMSALATHDGKEVVDAWAVARSDALRRTPFENAFATTGNLRNIQIGSLNYESSRGNFPANTFSASGQPLLSWRVHILPYIGYQNLYSKFKLAESWDSLNNLPLLAEMPDLYRMVGDSPETMMTHIMNFTGAGAPFPATGNNATRGPSQASIADGWSNTFSIIEAGRDVSVPWTMPADLPYRPNNPFAPLGDIGPNFIPAFFDGSVRGQHASISSDQLSAYITHRGNDNGTPPPVVPNVPDFFIRHSGGGTATTEFGADSFEVMLDKAPLTNVVLSLAVSNAAIATLDRQTITFTPANWNVAQRVVLRGVDNHAVNPHRTVDVTVAVVPAQSDDAYDSVLPQMFVATIRDDLRQFSADFATDGRINGNDFLAWQRGLGATSGGSNSQGDADNDGDVDRDDLTRWRAQVGLVNVVADFNASARIDGADFLAWQRGLGIAASATRAQGDADGDGDVDAADLAGWRSQFGVVVAAPTTASLPSSDVASTEFLAAAVIAQDDLEVSSALDVAWLAEASSLLTAGRTTSAAKLSRSVSFESGVARDHLFAQLDRVARNVAPSGHGATKHGDSSLPALAEVEDDDQSWTDLADDCLRREFVVPLRSAIAQ
jgi:hypothetical protein